MKNIENLCFDEGCEEPVCFLCGQSDDCLLVSSDCGRAAVFVCDLHAFGDVPQVLEAVKKSIVGGGF